MRWFIAILVYSLHVVVGLNINYCGAKMCGNSNTHTFCQYKRGPGPLCSGYMNAKLTSSEKSRILARLNRRRNEAAAGLLRGMPPAGNMMKLRWLEELASEAQLWADQCAPPNTPEEQDTCRNFYSISVGQCVASVIGEAPGLRVESMVDMWYMQNMLYKGNVTIYVPVDWVRLVHDTGSDQKFSEYQRGPKKKKEQFDHLYACNSNPPAIAPLLQCQSPEKDRSYYGDFGQMIWFRTFLVGCGRSRFMFLSLGRLRSVERLVCNFAPQGPGPYQMLWSPTIPATACPARSQPDRTLTALCDYQYDIKVSVDNNNSMTLEDNILLEAVLELERNEGTDEEGTLDKMFLTNLAVVTLDNPITKPQIISLQKRDVVENVDLESEHSATYEKMYKSYVENIFTPTYKRKKKMKVVGRPRSYNIEELNENGDDHTEENLGENLTRDAFYSDYVLIDGQEYSKIMMPEAVTYSISLTNVTENLLHEKGTVVFNISETVYVSGDISRNTPDSEIINSSNGVVKNTESVIVNETQIASIDKIYDYLSDPETVKQLQEALDRAERVAAPTVTHGKVRRDLKNYQSTSSLPPENERNRTIERGPMLSMVLKYMPYLKNYEKELLGSPAGNRSLRLVGSLCTSIVIIFDVVYIFILF